MLHSNQGARAPSALSELSTASLLPAGTPSLYILTTQDRSRIKLGRTGSDLDRVVSLKYRYPEIDLSRSVMIGVDDGKLENVLHRVFGLRRSPLSKRGDGHTEWFTGDFVEEVLAFVAHIGQLRGKIYPVVRNLDALIEAQRARFPKGPRPPREEDAVRDARTQQEMATLHAQVLAQTDQVIAQLNGFGFDAILQGPRDCLLARTVHRDAEPDAWELAESSEATLKSRALADAARISVTVGNCSCTFSLLDMPYCTVINDQRAFETLRIGQGPNERLLPGESNPIDAAFAKLWSALARLPFQPYDPLRDPSRRTRSRSTPIRGERFTLDISRHLKSSQ